MSIELPPFSGDNTRCIKCGEHGAATQYENENMPHVPMVAGAERGPFEWLSRTCVRCGYNWCEACLTS